MRHAKSWLGVGASGIVLLAIACSAQDADSAFLNPNGNAGTSPADGGPAIDKASSGGPTTSAASPGIPVSDGVLLVHSASFPAFRLCFENFLDQTPQPDKTVMPDANVVGVEMGSLVRINRLEAPGRIYVIAEKRLRLNGLGDKKCSALVPPKGATTGGALDQGSDYLVTTNTLPNAIGQEQADVLVFTGCGTQTNLNNIDGVTSGKASHASCGDLWDDTAGNLKATVVPLQASNETPSASQIPVQLYDVSAAAHALGGKIDVTFGERDKTPLPLTVGALFASGTRTKLEVNQEDIASYGSLVFNVKVTFPGLPTGPVTVAPSLADVQQLSSPTDLPTAYYKTASNYALLLLGDPSHKPTLSGGGDNPNYNPRRALHILAVPVLDPSKADAGTTPTPGADAAVP